MYRTPYWLRDLESHSLGYITLTPEAEQHFSRRALAGRGKPAERDALFAELGAHVAHSVRRYRGWNLAPWDLDDVAQESYLAFIDLHQRWLRQVRLAPDGSAQPGFGYYILRLLPLRLDDRVDALRGVSHAHLLDPTPIDILDEPPDPRPLDDDQHTRDLITSICHRLPARDAVTFRQVIAAGYSVRTVARRTGVHPRTLYSRWARITRVARDVVRDHDAA